MVRLRIVVGFLLVILLFASPEQQGRYERIKTIVVHCSRLIAGRYGTENAQDDEAGPRSRANEVDQRRRYARGACAAQSKRRREDRRNSRRVREVSHPTRPICIAVHGVK
ncbi:MAG: hypothetical protein IH899_00240 [Planctomycetes bacterium]|nr:hypothetical protein [Planctomycetota bacterium]